MTPYLIPHIPRHRCAHVYDICGEATDYERALRYNINEVERSSLVEMLALLKGVHAALARAQGDPEVRLRRVIGSRPNPHTPRPISRYPHHRCSSAARFTRSSSTSSTR